MHTGFKRSPFHKRVPKYQAAQLTGQTGRRRTINKSQTKCPLVTVHWKLVKKFGDVQSSIMPPSDSKPAGWRSQNRTLHVLCVLLIALLSTSVLISELHTWAQYYYIILLLSVFIYLFHGTTASIWGYCRSAIYGLYKATQHIKHSSTADHRPKQWRMLKDAKTNYKCKRDTNLMNHCK